MCNCIKDVEEKTIDHVTKSRSKHGETVLPLKYDGGLQGVAFSLGSGSSKLYLSFIYFVTFVKKDKTTSSPKKRTVDLFFTYCPFCGEKYPVESTEDAFEDVPDQKGGES